MKSQLSLLSKTALLSLFVAGCGGGSSTSDSGTAYSAEYDLSQYVVPAKSQTNVYREIQSEKANTENSYTEVDSQYTYLKYDVNGTTITTSDSDVITITDNTIIKENIDSEIAETERIGKIGDIFLEKSGTVLTDLEEDSAGTDIECKLSQQLAEMVVEGETYNDVILFECTSKMDENVTVIGDQVIRVNHEGNAVSYFAKDIGRIHSIDEACNTITVDSTTSSTNCTKVESSLITVIE